MAGREKHISAGEQQADFRKGLTTSLSGWSLPQPAVGEFAGNYLKRIAGEVMGIVWRALNTVWEYSRKKAELEKVKVTFEAEVQAKEKQYAVRMAVLEKLHAEKIRRLQTA